MNNKKETMQGFVEIYLPAGSQTYTSWIPQRISESRSRTAQQLLLTSKNEAVVEMTLPKG